MTEQPLGIEQRCTAITTAIDNASDLLNGFLGDARELEQIRATLLVNFGDVPRNVYGFKIVDDPTQPTINLLLSALGQLAAKIR